eukprot:TRINITY_DN104464_c0_g1_i1.p1 TRINITY_DN104464_c0_g1~~TRINITY_DN104464_c0_g1_i1.p1  ORF type:complete len:505 (-),score=30.12 TRINITY_DN104464_c0_g1_i1:22-1500(-)
MAAVLLLVALALQSCCGAGSARGRGSRSEGCTATVVLIQSETQTTRTDVQWKGAHSITSVQSVGHGASNSEPRAASRAVGQQRAAVGRVLFQNSTRLYVTSSGEAVVHELGRPLALLATLVLRRSSSYMFAVVALLGGVLTFSLMICCWIQQENSDCPCSMPVEPTLPAGIVRASKTPSFRRLVHCPGALKAQTPKAVRFLLEGGPPDYTSGGAENIRAPSARNSYRPTLLRRALKSSEAGAGPGCQPLLGRASSAPLKSSDMSSLLPSSVSGQPKIGRTATTPLVENRFSPSTLCQGLVVPQGCECNLVVPVSPLRCGPLSIFDPAGDVVMRVLPCTGNSISQSIATKTADASQGEIAMTVNRHLELTTASGDVLAQTYMTSFRSSLEPRVNQVNTEFDFFRADGSYYATLQSTEHSSYQLTTSDSKLFFWGSLDCHTINVADHTGKILGATSRPYRAGFDPDGKYFRLRAAPLTDVGLLLCSLVCIIQSR